nr:UPF0280 family protein [Roseospira marina]
MSSPPPLRGAGAVAPAARQKGPPFSSGGRLGFTLASLGTRRAAPLETASHRLLPDGRRMHLHHGPIDLIVTAEGAPEAVRAAYGRAVARFETVLTELVAELPVLRSPVPTEGTLPLTGAIARRMAAAAWPYRPGFVTPMAAVAGAVAEAVLEAIIAAPGLTRAAVNNGGDIALWLAPGAAPWRIGLVVDPADPASPGAVAIPPDSPVRGVATSGRHGRSLTLGLADSVTVLAPTAAAADVAATLIANAVDCPGHPAVTRVPACTLHPDSDLGDRLVTVEVGPLSPDDVAAALDAGATFASECIDRGLVHGAVLVLHDRVRVVGALEGARAPSSIPDLREVPLHV